MCSGVSPPFFGNMPCSLPFCMVEIALTYQEFIVHKSHMPHPNVKWHLARKY